MPPWSICARRREREKHGLIPGSLHAPYPDLADNVRPGGMLHALAGATGKRLVFYCAFGERSAMAVQAAQGAGIVTACHIEGGIDAWKKAGGRDGGARFIVLDRVTHPHPIPLPLRGRADTREWG